MYPPAYMNEILFGQKNFFYSKENFLLLAPYMLTHEVYSEIENTCYTNNTPIKPKVLEFHKDTLFWSIYVAMKGEQEYTLLKRGGHNMINVMMKEKKLLSDHFNAKPEQLKLSNYRITLAKINEIKCNLMTKPMDTIESCLPCAIYYNRPIVVYFTSINAHVRFVSKNYVSDDADEGTNVIDETVYLTLTNNKIILQKPENLGYELYHYEKPLQGISNYKGDELKNIYEQIFNSTADTNLKKPEYYETVMVKCSNVLQTKII
jgi:hypothetical protein